MNISNSLLSTTPFISLRFPGDDSGIIKLSNEYSETCDLVMLASLDGVDKLICAHCQTARFDTANVLSHLVERLKDEAGIDLHIRHWGKGVNLVDVGWGNYSMYMGTTLLGTFGTHDVNGRTEADIFNLVIPDQLATYSSSISRLATAEILRNSRYVSSNEQRIIEKIVRLLMDLESTVVQIYLKKYNIPCKNLSHFREWLADQDKATLLKLVRSTLAFHGGHRTSVVHMGSSLDGTVYVTRSAGMDASKVELSMHVTSNSPAIFIVLDKEPSGLTSLFLAGYIEQAFRKYGTEKAFRNRFKFIGFEGKQNLINEAIKAVLNGK